MTKLVFPCDCNGFSPEEVQIKNHFRALIGCSVVISPETAFEHINEISDDVDRFFTLHPAFRLNNVHYIEDAIITLAPKVASEVITNNQYDNVADMSLSKISNVRSDLVKEIASQKKTAQHVNLLLNMIDREKNDTVQRLIQEAIISGIPKLLEDNDEKNLTSISKAQSEKIRGSLALEFMKQSGVKHDLIAKVILEWIKIEKNEDIRNQLHEIKKKLP